MKIGKHLRKKRHEKKSSQQEIADFINVSQKTYSNFESDKSTPSILQLVKLSDLLLDFLNFRKKLLNIPKNNFYFGQVFKNCCLKILSYSILQNV